jgi:hypothetical protein
MEPDAYGSGGTAPGTADAENLADDASDSSGIDDRIDPF